MEKRNKILLTILMIFNSLIGVTNRILQICYYCITKDFEVDTVKKAALTFCILPSVLNVFMMSLYCILHSEENLTPIGKLKNTLVMLFVIFSLTSIFIMNENWS